VTSIGATQSAEHLRQKADQLRIHSIRATTQAGNGHPASCSSAANTARIIDLYSIAPNDVTTFKQAAKAANNLVLTVEEHYLHGGLCDAVLSSPSTEGVRLHKTGIQEIAHNRKPEQLLEHYGINARAITKKSKQIV
jgi:transketolase